MKTIALITAASLCSSNLACHWIFGTSMDDVIERSFFQCAAIFAHTASIHFVLKRKT